MVIPIWIANLNHICIKFGRNWLRGDEYYTMTHTCITLNLFFWNSLEWIFFHFYSVRILLGSSPCRIAFITVLWCAQLNKRTFTAWHNVMLQCHSNWVEPRTPEESLLSFRAKQTAISDFTTSIKRSLTEKCNELPRMRKLLNVFLS